MWKPILALLVASAVAVPAVALAAGGESTTTPAPPAASPPCTPLKRIYSEHHWRERHPLRGQTPCHSKNAKSIKSHFNDYRHYRQIATMRCTGGDEGYYVPNPGSCSTIACESHFSWGALNPTSHADGAYQLLGHGEPWPVRTFRDRLRHHEIASTLPRSSWVC